MRYIRFLKTPRIVSAKGTDKRNVHCLITITSDLGDSFFPHHVELAAELMSVEVCLEGTAEEFCKELGTLVWRTVKWTAGMRTLAVTLPLKKSYASKHLRVRIGTEPKAAYDTFDSLSEADSHGIVSAWSAHFNTPKWPQEAEKLVERRFNIAGKTIKIWEETGESIARHVWDAGIAFSFHMAALLDHPADPLSKALLRLHNQATHPEENRIHFLELGTGCGIVGITLTCLVPGLYAFITDLDEAGHIASLNIKRNTAHLPKDPDRDPTTALQFVECDWDATQLPTRSWDHAPEVVFAADCTYNADSSPALVRTLVRLTRHGGGSDMLIAIAMKMRHASENVFFELMADAGFEETAKLAWPLPGDNGAGEETVYLHVYRPAGDFAYADESESGSGGGE